MGFRHRTAMVTAALLAAGLTAGAAQADIVTLAGSFTATDWDPYGASEAPPLDPLYLSYSVTFDNALTYVDDASVLTVIATNIPGSLTFSYAPFWDSIVIATISDPIYCPALGNFVCMFGHSDDGTPTRLFQGDGEGAWWYANSVTRGIPGDSTVPEPASWAMLIAGFGVLGGRLRRGRRIQGSA